jgi:hypothetical protein
MYIGRQVNYTLFLLVFFFFLFFPPRNLNFLDRLSKNTQISDFMKISSVRVKLFHAGGRTDMKLIVAFRNFANALKTNCNIFYCTINEGLGVSTKGPKTCVLLNAVGAHIL